MTIINVGQVNLAKTTLGFRHQNWKRLDPMEWCWEMRTAMHRFYESANKDAGLTLCYVILAGLCQHNEMLNFEKLSEQVIDNVVENLANKTFSKEAVRGIVCSGEQIILGSLSSGGVPQLPLVATAGAGLIAFLNEWE